MAIYILAQSDVFEDGVHKTVNISHTKNEPVTENCLDNSGQHNL